MSNHTAPDAPDVVDIATALITDRVLEHLAAHGARHQDRQLLGLVDLAAIELQNDVTRFQSGTLSRTVFYWGNNLKLLLFDADLHAYALKISSYIFFKSF